MFEKLPGQYKYGVLPKDLLTDTKSELLKTFRMCCTYILVLLDLCRILWLMS